jgi:hypothetical protein
MTLFTYCGTEKVSSGRPTLISRVFNFVSTRPVAGVGTLLTFSI